MIHQHTYVIGLTGPAGSGKDTAAAILQRHVPGTYVVAFADALRREASNAFGVESVYFTRRETKEAPLPALALRKCQDNGFIGAMFLDQLASGGDLDLDAPRSPRQIMQWWGTEYRRTAKPGYWVSKVADRIGYLQRHLAARLIVVTDVRFDDEATLILAAGGSIWQLQRPSCGIAPSAHKSEVTGESFAPSAIIHNSGDMRHLQQQVMGTWAALEWRLPGVTVTVPQPEGAAA